VSEPFRTVMGDNFGGAVMLYVYVGEEGRVFVKAGLPDRQVATWCCKSAKSCHCVP